MSERVDEILQDMGEVISEVWNDVEDGYAGKKMTQEAYDDLWDFLSRAENEINELYRRHVEGEGD